MNKKSRVLVNPARTASQLIPAAVLTEFGDAWIYDMNDKQYASLLSMLLLLTSVVHNYVETKQQRAWEPEPL